MSSAEQCSVEIRCTSDDYKEYAAIVRQNYSANNSYNKAFLWIAFIAPYALGLFAARALVRFLIQNSYLPNDVTLFAILTYLVIIYFCQWVVSRLFKLPIFDVGGRFCVARHVTISPEGFSEETENFKGTTQWRGMTQILDRRDYILFYVDKLQAYLVPKRFFTGNALAENFLSLATAYWRTANTDPTVRND